MTRTLVFAPTLRRAMDAARDAGIAPSEMEFVTSERQLQGRRPPLDLLFAEDYFEHPSWPTVEPRLRLLQSLNPLPEGDPA